MAGETSITVIGNVVAEPELRWTPNQVAVTSFRIASTPRNYNKEAGQWEDGEALFLTCNIWRQAAENVAESIHKGARIIVVGKLKQRSYQTKEGENRTSYEVEVEEVGPSLKYATVTIHRNEGNGAGGGQSQGQGGPWPDQGNAGGGIAGFNDDQPQTGGFGQSNPTGGFGVN